MSRYYILYNPFSGEGKYNEMVKTFKEKYSDVEEYNVTEISDYNELFSKLEKDDSLVICGGDGTLNRFVNATKDIEYKNDIYLMPTGNGNDFVRDLEDEKDLEFGCKINKYIENLPTVTVNGKDYLFINGVGYGIDGYCCEVGDEQKKVSSKKVNYTAIAIKGLLFHYKQTNATVTVDGEKHTYNKVWLAPTMKGRFYGGGMIPAPEQRRTGKNRKLSVTIMHNCGKLKALSIFPSIFKGEHVKYKNQVAVMSGNEITVEFDRPTALQIDGETILGVTKYTAKLQ